MEGNIPNTTSHIELFLTMKVKNKLLDGYQYEMQKSQDEEGNKAYKILASQVEEGNNPNTIFYVELFMTTMKIKILSAMEASIKCKKSWDGGGNNAYKIFMSWVVEGNIPNTTSHMELFMATIKMKNNFCDGYQYEMQKNLDGGGNNAFKVFTS